jgi:hypothetical protein
MYKEAKMKSVYIVKEPLGWYLSSKGFLPPNSEVELSEQEAQEYIKAGIKLEVKKKNEK